MHSAVCAGFVLCHLHMLTALTSRGCSWMWASVFISEWSSCLPSLYCSVTPFCLWALFILPFQQPYMTTQQPSIIFSWLMFSILHCSLLQALLCRKTLIKAPAVENSIGIINISVCNVCWCPQTALLYFHIKHACCESCNVCLRRIHSAWVGSCIGFGEEQSSHFFRDITDRIDMTFHCLTEESRITMEARGACLLSQHWLIRYCKGHFGTHKVSEHINLTEC